MEKLITLSVVLCVGVSARAVEANESEKNKCRHTPKAGEIQLAEEFDILGPESYWYVAERDQYVSFYYSGFKGNDNRFTSLDGCRKACVGSVNDGYDTPFSGKHELPHCFMYLAVWLFTHMAVAIRLTQEQCEKTCKLNPCGEEAFSGSINDTESIYCTLDIPKYSYKPEFNRCPKYSYGGCGANLNHFDTLEECEKRCAKSARP